MESLPRIRSQESVDPAALRTLVKRHINSVKFAPESTQELILVFDKVNWIGLYWNNVSGNWNISVHKHQGWKQIISLSTENLRKYIDELHDLFSDIHSVQYRNVNGADIYTR